MSQVSAVVSRPLIASHVLVIAAVANAKAAETAFYAAVAEADSAKGVIQTWRTYRHVRDTCAAVDKAHAQLRAAVQIAEDDAEALMTRVNE